MAILDQDKVDKIKQHLRWNPLGLTISDLTSKMSINRNLVAKYLDMLLVSGQVEMHVMGAAKVYFLSHRVPISAMLEFSSDYILVIDAEQRVIQVNEQFITFLSETRDSLVGKKIGEINHPFFSSFPALESIKNRKIFDQKTTEISCVLHGEPCYFRVKQIPAAFEDGSQGLMFIIEDITTKKTFEKTLQMSEARYRGIVEDQTEFITRFLPDGTLIFVNESYAQYLGKKPSELIGSYHIPVIYEDDRAIMDQTIQSLDRDHPVTTMDCRISDPFGQIRWHQWTIRALFNDGMDIHDYQGMGKDITENKEGTARINQYISNMNFFSRKLQEFIEIPPDADIFNAIGEGLEILLPHAIIIVNNYDPKTKKLRKNAIFGKRARDFVTRCHENNFLWNVSPAFDTLPEILMTRTLHRLEGALHEATFEQISVETCVKIEESLNLGKFYSIGLITGENLLGNIIFVFQKDESIENISLIEAYARAASIALQRQIAEVALKDSEMKRTEEALKNSENYLLTIFNSTQSGLVVIEPKTRTIFDANSTAIELIGANKGNIVGSPCNKYLCSVDMDVCPLIDLGQELKRSEGVLIDTNNKTKSIIKTVVPIQLNGHPYLLESFIDITDRKKAEEALRENEKRFHDLAEMLPQSVWECDAEGNLTFVNHRSLEIYRYSAEDLNKGLNIWEMIHPDDRQRVLNDFIQASMAEPKEFPESHRYTALRKDGSTFPVIIYHVPKVHENKITGMRGIGIDITERVLAEEALRESEARLNTILQCSPIPKFVIDSNHQVIYWNEALEKYSEIKAVDVIGTTRQWSAFYPHERPCLADLLIEGKRETVRELYTKKNTRSRFIDGAVEVTDFFPHLGEEGKWLMGTAVTIKDRNGNICGAVETIEECFDAGHIKRPKFN